MSTAGGSGWYSGVRDGGRLQEFPIVEGDFIVGEAYDDTSSPQGKWLGAVARVNTDLGDDDDGENMLLTITPIGATDAYHWH